MELDFTLSKMEELYSEAMSYYNIYKNALEELNQIINNLAIYWKSDETYTYQEFYQRFKEQYPKLLEAKEMMYNFCNKIEERKNEFKEVADSSINSFE